MLVTATVALGCKDKTVDPRADAAASVSAPLPPDHLAPGEIAEGKLKAFALPLPRDVEIVREFPGVVVARSKTVTPEQVANYFRARVRDGSVSSGSAETRFLNVHATAEPTRDLAIEIRTGLMGVSTCEIMIRDMTRPPSEPGLSEAERRKRAGLTPDGKILDPKHLE